MYILSPKRRKCKPLPSNHHHFMCPTHLHDPYGYSDGPSWSSTPNYLSLRGDGPLGAMAGCNRLLRLHVEESKLTLGIAPSLYRFTPKQPLTGLDRSSSPAWQPSRPPAPQQSATLTPQKSHSSASAPRRRAWRSLCRTASLPCSASVRR